jgi:CrcB protein
VNGLWLVMAGGALGSAARWAVGLRLGPSPSGWPWATLTVNAVGAFVIALLAALPAFEAASRPEARLFLVTGVLGGFTTYASFNQETLAAIASGHPGRAFAYAAATLAGCLVSGFAGHAVGRLLG